MWMSLALCASAQSQYDLILKGGHVIDAKNGIDDVRDVAISAGKIAAVAPNLSADLARRVVDVSSLYVTPGLVDIHTHVFADSMQREYTGENGVRPDGFTFRSGVTTIVDAGSSGWRNFEQFRRNVIEHSKTRVFAMLNIVGSGMGGRLDVEQNTADMEPAKTADMAKRYPRDVVGVKIAHYKGPEWVAVERAVEAGNWPAYLSWWISQISAQRGRFKIWWGASCVRAISTPTHICAQCPCWMRTGRFSPIFSLRKSAG